MKKTAILGLVACVLGLGSLVATELVQAEPPAKVLICHVDPDCDGEGPHVISVSERALDAHLAHGDCLAAEDAEKGDACPDMEECDYPECD
jgi:hypothetical protein